jgi:hypothetical protein
MRSTVRSTAVCTSDLTPRHRRNCIDDNGMMRFEALRTSPAGTS